MTFVMHMVGLWLGLSSTFLGVDILATVMHDACWARNTPMQVALEYHTCSMQLASHLT